MSLTDLTRRSLLRRAIAAGSAVGLCRLGAGCGDGNTNGRPLALRPTNSDDPIVDMQSLVQTMVDFGPRLTGNPAHVAFIDWCEVAFRAVGCETKRDPHKALEALGL